MEIPQIISPDGQINEIHPRDNGEKILRAQFLFPFVSDYICGAIKEGKPYIFSGRSGNAQIGIKTDQLAQDTLPRMEGSDIFLEGQIQNLNPLVKNTLELFKNGDVIGRAHV